MDTVTGQWWESLPVGWYAIPVYHYDYDLDESWPVQLTTFRRTRNGFRIGNTYTLAGMDRVPVEERDVYRGWSLADLRDVADALVRDADELRANFGLFTGMCGCCGRRLTDPASKLRGIGPDCWAAIGGAK